MADGATLDQELGQLLEQETFPPPEEFRERAVVSDPSIYDAAEADPEGFWAQQAEALHWDRKWDRVLDWSNPPFAKWFVGGRLNVSYNCLDRHVEAGLGDRVAFHWRGEEGEERDITYASLHADVQRFANALKDRGIGAGDVVGIFLPMIPEVAVAMLACARIGAVHNVVFGGFSAESVKERMEFSEAKALITVDGARRKGKTAPIKQQVDEVMGGLEARDRASSCATPASTAPMADGKDVWFDELMEAADPECPAEPLDAEHPLFILYTSGSTAKPKGILHTTGGYLTQVAYTHKAVFDLKPDEDVYWCSADVGWVTGHSYIVYGPLANGATSVMYEGAPDYPDKDIWWELCERYGVTIFYTAPTAIRACIKWGAEYPERHDLSKLRLLGTVGEPINPKAWLWYHKVIGGERCPIVDTWWQTETGGIMITTLPGIVDDQAGLRRQAAARACRRPSSTRAARTPAPRRASSRSTRPWPGMLRTLYKEEDRFIETYWSKFGRDVYTVGDAARRDEDGYFWIIGRTDDVLNVSGHRMSTAEIESAIVSYSQGRRGGRDRPGRRGHRPVGDRVRDARGRRATATRRLIGDIREHVAKRIGKLARPKRIIWADDLPKTRSGKIMRRLLRDIAEGRELGDVTTLRDPDVMAQLGDKIKERQAEED